MPTQGEQSDASLDKSSIEDLLIGIDCEMVATPHDDNALARISAVNGRCELVLDRLVAPDETPTDFRTHITGIQAKDLEDLKYTREHARADLLKFITPRTVLVGHTLHKDLAALRLDAPLVVDVGLLYSLEGLPTRRPGLAHMMDAVLGEENFRPEDGQHDSTHDASAAMRILLHRLSYPWEDVARVVIPPPLLADSEAAVDEARTLYAHRVLDRPGTFTALVALFAAAGAGMGAESLERVDMQAAQKGWRSARILFATSAEAERVFLALSASSAKVDRAGRPQKMVEMSIPGGETTSIYVRTMSADVGGAALSKRPKATPPGYATPAQDGAAAPSTNENGTAEVGGETSRPWKGWKRALDDELTAAGGALPWKRLRSALVTSCHKEGATADEGDDVLGNRALACIPNEYLSKDDALVRAPRGTT